MLVVAPALVAADVSSAAGGSGRILGSGTRRAKSRFGPNAVASAASDVASGKPEPEEDEEGSSTGITGNFAAAVQEDANPDAVKEQLQESAGEILNTVLGREQCDCDCCQVTQRTPGEIITTNNSEQITGKCEHQMSSDTDEQQAACPAQCIDNGGIIQADKSGNIDYSRFCAYNCRPSSNDPGSACILLNRDEAEDAATDDTNARLLNLPPVSMEPGAGWGSPGTPSGGSARISGLDSNMEARTEEASLQGLGDAAAEEKKLKVTFDMRKLLAERMRAETGAAMARGTASTERVRMNKYLIGKAAEKTNKASSNVSPLEAKVQEGTSVAEGDSEKAIEAENEATRNALNAENSISQLLKDSRSLAKTAIEKKAKKWVDFQAEAIAVAKGEDKPDRWEKVLAARAADPYMQAVSVAVQRTSEYKALADNLVDQANSAQVAADKIAPHMNALEATGDTLGAKMDRLKISNLLARSRSLQSQAQKFWTMADDARKTVPEWTDAAMKAAARAAWEFKNPPK